MPFFTRISLAVCAACLFILPIAHAQISFSNANANLSATDVHSGCPTAVVDVNGDGLDDIVRLDQAHLLYIDYQRPGLLFDHHYIGDFSGGSGWAWGMCVADVDHNGYKDVVAGGYGPAVKIMKLDNTGTAGTIYNLPSSNFFLQNINFADINNDGWEDIFGCNDDAESYVWLNNGAGNFTVSSIIDFDVTDTDDSGNYGSLFTDFDNDGDIDLYIAKCRQAVNNPADGRRIDVLFVNDGNNNYTSDAAAYGLADSAQTWTANFADIDNDGDLDVIQTDYDVPANLLENDGTGHMTNITAGSGFNLNIIPIESVMEDFDNDGYVDILVTGSDYQFFRNNGNKTFTKLPGIFGPDNMESFAIGDLNHDGKIDVYGSYAEIYTTPSGIADVYWMNTSENTNHFITLNLIGTTSNEGALGARAEIYGTWGKQIREVHAGESYGTCNTANLHFGTGAATLIDSVVVRWPSGAVTSISHPSVDQFITIKENECVTPDLTVINSGGTIICPGQSVTLTASIVPAGFSYLWSNGATTQSIEVNTTGNYSVKISSVNNECFTTSKAIGIVQNPAEIPIITASGELTFCEGGSVVLSGPAGTTYSWSNGAITQSITVTQSGSYSLTTPGTCQSWTSEAIDVTALISPAPVVADVHLATPGIATLTATGNAVSWYDVSTGGSPLSTGNTFVTPFLNDTTVYYAEDVTAYGADTLYVGQQYHEGNLYSSGSTNSAIIFDVLKSSILKSVKVYTDTPGPRLIEWKNHNGVLLQSAMVDIPIDSSRITLNFNLEPGNSYELSTNKEYNMAVLGNYSPRLQRSDEGVTYPYVIENLVSLTGSPNGSTLYYYFYDWEVEKIPSLCISDRVPVTVYVDFSTGVSPHIIASELRLFPNPTSGLVTIATDAPISGMIKMELVDVTGRTLLSQSENGLDLLQKIQLDLSTLTKGIYFLNIKSGANTLQHKVVVQ
ncbi:MAG TPA: FG-GAP-like repeat-containing protein [Chitinophagales bacterium]|nr:FG-GAP-like repeat-containing protein [Chitinophagales bacterium]